MIFEVLKNEHFVKIEGLAWVLEGVKGLLSMNCPIETTNLYHTASTSHC